MRGVRYERFMRVRDLLCYVFFFQAKTEFQHLFRFRGLGVVKRNKVPILSLSLEFVLLGGSPTLSLGTKFKFLTALNRPNRMVIVALTDF